MTGTTDPRFDEAESEVDYGDAWYFRNEGAPNPLTIEATEWSTGTTTFGETDFLKGTDRDGKHWSVLVGSLILKERLIEGIFTKWDDDKGEFVVDVTLGRVQPGEVVSIKYLGDIDGAKFKYPNFKVSRKAANDAKGNTSRGADAPTAAPETAPAARDTTDVTAAPAEDDIPF